MGPDCGVLELLCCGLLLRLSITPPLQQVQACHATPFSMMSSNDSTCQDTGELATHGCTCAFSVMERLSRKKKQTIPLFFSEMTDHADHSCLSIYQHDCPSLAVRWCRRLVPVLQTTLYLAAGSLALQEKLNVGVLAESVALATVPYSHNSPAWPRSSALLEPGSAHFVHYHAYTPEEEEK